MHLKRASMGLTLFCASFNLALETISVHAQERTSPDKQWEYQYSNGVGPQIVKAGTSEVVLDLSDASKRIRFDGEHELVDLADHLLVDLFPAVVFLVEPFGGFNLELRHAWPR